MFTYLKMFFSLMIAASHGPGTAGTIGDTSRLSSPFFRLFIFLLEPHAIWLETAFFYFISFPSLYYI